MRLIRLTADYIDEVINDRIGLRGPQLESCALTIGSFDGLHRGHQALIQGVAEARTRLGLEAAGVFTFMQHPQQVLNQGRDPFLLTAWREKLSVLHDLDCQVVIAADFCPALSNLRYEDFVEKFLVRYLGMQHLVCGHDVHLGAKRGGNAETLADLGDSLGYTMEVFPAVREDQQIISSSAIRRLIAGGDLAAAKAMLGRAYAVWGEVMPGERRGRELGFPTANIQALNPMKLMPASGVYAVRVQVPADVVTDDGQGALEWVQESLPEVDLQGDLLSAASGRWAVFGGMLNFGHVPTFHRHGLLEPRLEAHIFGFDGDLRGRNIKVEWLQKLRPERKFAGAADLIEQLNKDTADAQRVLGLSGA